MLIAHEYSIKYIKIIIAANKAFCYSKYEWYIMYLSPDFVLFVSISPFQTGRYEAEEGNIADLQGQYRWGGQYRW